MRTIVNYTYTKIIGLFEFIWKTQQIEYSDEYIHKDCFLVFMFPESGGYKGFARIGLHVFLAKT